MQGFATFLPKPRDSRFCGLEKHINNNLNTSVTYWSNSGFVSPFWLYWSQIYPLDQILIVATCTISFFLPPRTLGFISLPNLSPFCIKEQNPDDKTQHVKIRTIYPNGRVSYKIIPSSYICQNSAVGPVGRHCGAELTFQMPLLCYSSSPCLFPQPPKSTRVDCLCHFSHFLWLFLWSLCSYREVDKSQAVLLIPWHIEFNWHLTVNMDIWTLTVFPFFLPYIVGMRDTHAFLSQLSPLFLFSLLALASQWLSISFFFSSDLSFDESFIHFFMHSFVQYKFNKHACLQCVAMLGMQRLIKQTALTSRTEYKSK